MARVQRNNVILTVKDSEVPHYILRGYNRIAEDGSVIQQAIPNDMGTLQKLYLEQSNKIAELENTVAKLTSELMDAQRAKTTRKKKSDTQEE